MPHQNDAQQSPDARGEDDAIAFLRTLVAAQRKGEAAVQDALRARLEASGCVVEARPYDPAEVPVQGEFASARAQTAGGRVNIVARLPGDPSRRSLLMFAHPDSEPVVAEHGWTHDPFAGAIRDGRLHGWGVADDLAGVAAGVLAIDAVATQDDGAARGDVILISAPSKRHARGVAAALHDGVAADGALYLHPAESGAGLNEIKAFASGQLEFRITVTGKAPPTSEPGHTAFAHLGVNPLDKALVLVAALRALDLARAARVHHPALEAAVGRSTNLMISELICTAGGKLGRLPREAVIGGAVSFPPGETLDDIQAELRAAVDAACAGDDWLAQNPARIDWVAGVTGAECPPEHPLYRCAAAAVAAQTGAQPHVNPMHTSSDIRNPMVQRGIPTVGLGGLCGDLTQNGRTDEWVDVADYLHTVAAVQTIIRDWCAAPRG